ncbi:MAG: response regulator [bacterium]|nr:response regulator [bacterium]
MASHKILLVEDDQFLRDMYNELLSDEGFEVTACADGEEGYNKAMEGGFNLILLDIMLPKMDGLQILKNLQEKDLLSKNGPVVMLTNLGQDNIVKEGFDYGASGYLIKSAMTPDQVLHEVHTFLNTGKQS